MKKILIVAFVLTGTVFPLSVIHAADCANIGDSCTAPDGTAGTCAADPDTNGLYCLSTTYGTATANNPGGSSAPAVSSSNTSGTSGFVALAPIPGLTQGVTADQTGLATFFNNLYKYLIGLAAILAVIEIIWGGLEISTKDSVSKQSDGKERITQAIFGLVLVLSPVLVFSIINPSILNLSLNLDPLKTTSGTSAGTGSGAGTGTSATTPTTDANGCTIHNGQYLETALCPTQAGATSYTCANGANPKASGCLKNVTTGICTNINIVCAKEAYVYYYRATHGVSVFTVAGFAESVIPRDAPIQSAFATGCAADGGVMKASTVLAAKLRITTSVLMPGSGCPADSGIPDINTADQTGVLCYTEQLVCQK